MNVTERDADIEGTIIHIQDDDEPIEVGREHGSWYAGKRYGSRAWGPTLLHALGSLKAEQDARKARELQTQKVADGLRLIANAQEQS